MNISKSKNIRLIGLVLICCAPGIACHSNNPKIEENNKVAEVFNNTELYPDQKTAYIKKENTVLLYSPTSDHKLYLETNLKTHTLTIHEPDLLNLTGLLKINNFRYIFPKKYTDHYLFPLGTVGTGGGDFVTLIEVNELGLIKTIERNFPEGKDKYLYQYNKYGQLLKLIEDKLLDKVVLENRYDEKARLIFQKKNDKSYESERNLAYSKNNQIQKETIWQKEVAPNGNVIKDEIKTFLYAYNNQGQLIKKYTPDRNDVIEYTYNSEHQLTGILEYSGTISTDDPQKIVNHFVKKTYAYLEDEVIEEVTNEYNIVNSSVLMNGKWKTISIEEQKKQAWGNLKNQSAIPLQSTEIKYSYQPAEINIIINKYHIYTNYNGKKGPTRQLVDSDSIKYRPDHTGRIIKKETYNHDTKEMEVQKLFY
ncbi:hypothetical protein [Chryseobacterium sp. MYb328]|uniref:hypothetical protein n=1 Tax=Chryseobacterium sp. MYb328 TaxID=2745231 RepID=UPI003094D239